MIINGRKYSLKQFGPQERNFSTAWRQGLQQKMRNYFLDFFALRDPLPTRAGREFLSFSPGESDFWIPMGSIAPRKSGKVTEARGRMRGLVIRRMDVPKNAGADRSNAALSVFGSSLRFAHS